MNEGPEITFKDLLRVSEIRLTFLMQISLFQFGAGFEKTFPIIIQKVPILINRGTRWLSAHSNY
jgi:hypothetical protein